MPFNPIRQFSNNFLGADLVDNERRRSMNAQRDQLHRQNRVEQHERDIEMQDLFDQEEREYQATLRIERQLAREVGMELVDNVSIESASPITAAQWNREIRKTMDQKNNDSVDHPFIKTPKRPTPGSVDFCWACFWAMSILGLFGFLSYHFYNTISDSLGSFFGFIFRAIYKTLGNLFFDVDCDSMPDRFEIVNNTIHRFNSKNA